MIRRNKYGNRRIAFDGQNFDSMKEYRRYQQLRLYEKAAEISQIEIHPKFALWVNDKFICSYIADFRYLDHGTGQWVVEDSKGVRTPVYRLKRKLMKACLGIEILET
jgi:hypothetical protein